jgi:hypothetical protein
MTKKLWMLMAMLAALGSIGLGIPVASANDQEVPFRGSYAGTVAFTGPATVHFSGTGYATHLGRSVNDGEAEITGPSADCPGGMANVNTETLTAANGDTLTLISDDVACPVSPGVLQGMGSWWVSGGTGRFRNTTGSGTIDGQSDFNQGVFEFELTGSLSAPNAG